ncbi:MAG: flagellar biosynthesis protein FlgN [Tateyamaria sp.]|nr:flagellar biosynthesis protein FlgN [Tateyamaria sp.]MDG2056116.1 flagellar biosynthesis protein FlgN [Tateyamaria sp.]
MTLKTLQSTIDSLDDLLDAERSALLSGDLDEVSRLHERKEKLIDSLNQLDADDHANLTTLNAKVLRNQTLLNTALDGIRSVARRLSAIRQVRQSLNTYDSKGRKSSVELGVDRSLEKRA